MHFSKALFVASAGLAGLVMATPASGTGCVHAINLIVNTCLKTEQPLLSACPPNDWTCMCTEVKAVLTCYNNCPTDPRRFGVEQQKTQWCAAAKAYGSTSSTAVPAAPTPTHAGSGSQHSSTAKAPSAFPTSSGAGAGASMAPTASSMAGASQSASGSASGSAKSTATSSSNAAAGVVGPSSGLLAILVGAFALL